MARESVLVRVRQALGRAASRPKQASLLASLAAPLLQVSSKDPQHLFELFGQNLESLGGKSLAVKQVSEVGPLVTSLLAGRSAVACNAAFLRECGITSLPNVQSGFTDRQALRNACATADVGITGADYALADTGTLVMLSSPEEARLISLLPPTHIAVFSRDRLLNSLDDLLEKVPLPAEQTSAMVLITGPSRTADIELILVRGVHGPGELRAIIAG